MFYKIILNRYLIMLNNLGERLRYLRERKNITQPQLADFINISYSSVQKHEADSGMNKSNFKKYLDFYECDRDWLLTGKGDPFPGQAEYAAAEPDGLWGKTDTLKSGDVKYNVTVYGDDDQQAHGSDPFLEDVSFLKEIYDYQDGDIIDAIRQNLKTFVRTVRREKLVDQQNKKINDLESKCRSLQEKLDNLEQKLLILGREKEETPAQAAGA